MSAWEAAGKSNEWYTPKWIFDALGCQFDLDVAPAREGKGFAPALAWRLSGLTDPWSGFVWMNPPFGGRNGIVPWLARFFEHYNGIALTPDRTSAPWFQRFAPMADALVFVTPKVKFLRPDGTTGNSPSCGTVLMGAGYRARTILENAAPKLGMLVYPSHARAA